MSRKRHTPADEPHFLVRTMAAEFRDEQSIAPHQHSWGQLIFSVSGVTSVWTDQGSWVSPPRWAVWAPAGVAHGMRFTGATSLRTLYLRPGLAGLSKTSAVIAVSPLLRELIVRAAEIGFLDDREPLHVAMTKLIVDEMRVHSTPALDLPLPQSALLRRIAEHVAQRPQDRSGHAALARRFGLGIRTLERGFVAETGLSFGRWRRQARFLHAIRRLGGGEMVKRVAVEAGYRSPSAFIAAFGAALESTPGCYFEQKSR